MTSTATHEEHKYDVLKATKSFNSATAEFENKERELGRERKELGASIHGLEAELKNVKGEYSKAIMQEILAEKRTQVKEVEVNLDMTIAERNGMNISDFLGDGSRTVKPIDVSNLRRSTMTDAQKVKLISKEGMDYYKKLQY